MCIVWQTIPGLKPSQKMARIIPNYWGLFKRLLRNPFKFYITPQGFNWTETILYFMYLTTIIVYLSKGFSSHDLDNPKITTTEYLMWIFNLGVIINEIEGILSVYTNNI